MIARTITIFSSFAYSGVAVGIQPPCEEAKLLGPSLRASAGAQVAIADEWAFVGAPNGGAGTARSGEVAVFERIGNGNWVRRANIDPSDPDRDDLGGFGDALALFNHTVIVGAWRDDHSGFEDAGAAYVFQRQLDDTWLETQKLVPADPIDNGYFGWRLAFDGETIFIGAPNADNTDGFNGPGALYLFQRNESGAWIEIDKMTGSDTDLDDRFGAAVEIGGDTLMVAAPGWERFGNTNEGVVYVFVREDNAWAESQMLDPPSPGTAVDRRLGGDIDILGDRVLIGADNETIPRLGHEDSQFAGAAYMFERDKSGTWRFTQRLQPADAHENNRFGWAVLLRDQELYIGAWDSAPGDKRPGPGAVYQFEFDPEESEWVQHLKFRPADDPHGQTDRFFGTALAASGDTMLIGAPGDDERGLNAGAAYVYHLNCRGERANLTALNVLDGRIISGGLPQIERSENSFLITEARVTGEVHQPHIMRLRITAQSNMKSATDLFLRIEGSISGGSVAVTSVRLRDWINGRFDEVDKFSMGTAESVHEIDVSDAARFVRAADGRIILEIRQVVHFPFTLNGFNTLLDHIELGVR